MFFAHRHGPLAASVVGVTLIAAGVLLLLERARTEGVARIWPIVLVVLGMGWVDETDDAWWLIGTGSWMLVDMAGAAVARSGAPLLIIAAGLAAFRQAAARTILFPSRERSHAN